MEGLGGIIAFAMGWLVAQMIKMFAVLTSSGRMSRKEAYAWFAKSCRGGGMPSGHTSSFVALTIYIGCLQGFGSVIFALSACMTVMVVYDALNVRRSVGEIGQEMKRAGKIKKVAMGHTMSEVAAGAIVGAVVGWVTWIVLGG